MQMWYIYMLELYSSIKKRKITKFLGKGMYLKMIIWSEVTSAQKDKYHMFCLICKP